MGKIWENGSYWAKEEKNQEIKKSGGSIQGLLDKFECHFFHVTRLCVLEPSYDDPLIGN